jgi:hypothetical protein
MITFGLAVAVGCYLAIREWLFYLKEEMSDWGKEMND